MIPMTEETKGPRHDTEASGDFDAKLGGLDVVIRQVNNASKKSVIFYAKTPDNRLSDRFRLYEFHRLRDTGEVLLPAAVGISRTLFLFLENRYGVRRIADKARTSDELDEMGL